MKNNMFRNPMWRVATIAICTTMLAAMPLLAQDNLAPAPPQADQSSQPDQAAPPMRGYGRHAGHQLERLTKRLNLSPDQVTQIKAINEDTRTQSMAVRSDQSLSQADRRSKMMEIRKTSRDKIRAVLNDDQKAKYDAMLAKRKERMKERRDGQNPPPPPPPADAPQQ